MSRALVAGLTAEQLTIEQYGSFLASTHPHGASVYHDPAWLTAVQDGLGLGVAILGLLDGNRPVAVLPGFTASRWGVRAFGSPLRGSMTPYLGWLKDPGADIADRTMLAAAQSFAARHLGSKYAEIGFLDPPTGAQEEPRARGWREARRETYMLDLRAGEAAVWSHIGQRQRNKVRKAQRAGITIESVTNRGIMEQLYPMVEAAYARHQAVSPHPKRFYLALHDRLVSQGLMEVFVARYQGEAIAIALVPYDRTQARNMSVGSRPEFHQLYPNNLLHWHIIAWACARGIDRYDFGGKGQPSIDRFKETFRPEPHAYSFYWTASPPVALARNAVLRAWPRIQRCRHLARRTLETIRRLTGHPVGHPSHQEGQ